MKRTSGSGKPYLASSVTEKALAANKEERLNSVLATLQECREALGDCRDTAQLVSLAILQLKLKLSRVADQELKDLCEAIMPDEMLAEASPDSKAPDDPGRRRSTRLTLVE
jgi:hypothetical protein